MQNSLLALFVARLYVLLRKEMKVYFAVSVPVPMKGAELFVAFVYHSPVYFVEEGNEG